MTCARRSGSSRAAKWPPLGISVQCLTSHARSAQARGDRTVSLGKMAQPVGTSIWESMGCICLRVESPEEVQPAIDKANEIDDRPVVLEFRVDSREKVFPMVPAGASNDEIITAQSHREVVQ